MYDECACVGVSMCHVTLMESRELSGVSFQLIPWDPGHELR